MENNRTTIKKIIDEFRGDLSPLYDATELEQIIRIVVRHFLGWNMADVKLRGEEVPVEDVLTSFRSAKEDLKKFRPIQYIIGMTSFHGIGLRLSPGVLIPRPETEELVGLVISENRQKQFQEFSILDIGTGSGCIAIALKKAFAYARTEAIDISKDALEIAGKNAVMNKAEVHFRMVDILDPGALSCLPGYHLIVSNPPYVTESERAVMKSNVLEFEPGLALFVPDSDPLLFYKAIGGFAWVHLIRPGTLWLEINERYGREVKKMMEEIGFDRVTVIRDLRNKDRFVRAEAKHVMADTSYWMVDKHLP
jgi:release factor glutamine methyltransferase